MSAELRERVKQRLCETQYLEAARRQVSDAELDGCCLEQAPDIALCLVEHTRGLTSAELGKHLRERGRYPVGLSLLVTLVVLEHAGFLRAVDGAYGLTAVRFQLAAPIWAVVADEVGQHDYAQQSHG